MKRFDKIQGPKPIGSIKTTALPKSGRLWGNTFKYESSLRDIVWLCHDSAVLGYVDSGRTSVRSECGSFIISAKTLIYVPPDFPYLEQRMGVETSGWFVSIPKAMCKDLPSTITTLEQTDLLIALGRRIASWIDGNRLSGKRKSLALTFINELKTAKNVKCYTIPIPYSARLRKVAEQVTSHPDDMKSLDSWAKFVGMSRRSFTRSFLEETGLSFAVWRRRVKLSAAIRALGGGKTVDEVSFDLGYQNPSTFISVFKKQFGTSPARFLKARLKRF